MSLQDNLRNLLAAIDKHIIEIQNSVTINEMDRQAKLVKLSKQRAKIEKDLEKATKADKSEVDYETSKNDIRDWLTLNDFYFVANQDLWFLRLDGNQWEAIKPHALMTMWPLLKERDFYSLFDEVLEEQGRKPCRAVYTFNKTPPDTLNMMHWDFCPLVDDGEPYHPFFDQLIHSLGNGLQENMDCLEQGIQHKHAHPEDYLAPALVMKNKRGGAGKSLLACKLLATVFGHDIADNVSIQDVLGRFNMHTIGKAVVFVNEAIEEKVDENALRRTIGSQRIYGEQKFMQKIPVDNTAWYIIAGNASAIRLADNDIDRRYSVIEQTRTLPEVVGTFLGIPPDQADIKIKQELQYVLLDKIEVGRWLNHLYKKWGHIDVIQALHGADYRRLCKVGTKWWDDVFEAILGSPNFKYIKKKTLFNIYATSNKSGNHGYGAVRRRQFYEHVTDWCSNYHPEIQEKLVRWVSKDEGPSTAEVFYNSNNPDINSQLENNDSQYVTEDQYGHILLRVEV